MRIVISNIIETSLIDVLHHTAMVIFFPYCNFRCPWCQNSPVVFGYEKREIELSQLVEIIRSNFVVDYVQINGGEPTLHPQQLKIVLSKVKEVGKKTSLCTNGSRPNVLKEVIPILDHLAMDIKAPLVPDVYRKVTGVFSDVSKIEESMKLSRKVPFVEFRTTVVPKLHTFEMLEDIANTIESINPSAYWVLQRFYPSDTVLDPSFRSLHPTDDALLENAKKVLESKYNLKIVIRK